MGQATASVECQTKVASILENKFSGIFEFNLYRAGVTVSTMKQKDEERIAESIAKTLAMMCVRNTFLEDLHAGKFPVSNTGDYSDVKVIDANGQEIPWLEISRFSDDEMKLLMKQVVNRIYTFLLRSEDAQFQDNVKRWMEVTEVWDKPELDNFFLQ